MPTCWIIAGPNGVGKTTFALQYLPQIAQCNRFINADLIAAGLSPLAPDRQLLAASRLAGRGDRLAGHGLPAVGTGSSARGATCAAGRTQHSRHQRQRQVQWTICKRVNIFIFLKEKFEFCQIGNDYANLFKFDPANCNVINRLSK